MEHKVRAFELPISRVELPDGNDGCALIRACFDHARALADWTTQQMRLSDVVVLPTMTDYVPWSGPDPYSRFTGFATRKRGEKGARVRESEGYPCREFFEGATQTATCIIQRAKDAYCAARVRVLWQGRGQFPEYRPGGMPWPVPAPMWMALPLGLDGYPRIAVRLPGPGRGDLARATLRLRGGPEFARQMAHFRHIIGEDKDRRTLELFARPIGSNSPHRPTLWMHGAPYRMMAKMIGYLPIVETKGTRTLTLVTKPDCFWMAELDGRPAWIWNADHHRRHFARLAQHESHLARVHRMGEDAKTGQRSGNNRAANQIARLERLCRKDHNRMASWLHETAAHVVGFCLRQKVREVIYDDTCKEYIRRFPWYRLTQMLRDKLAPLGIALHCASTTDGNANQGE